MCNNDNNAAALLPYGQSSFATALPSPTAAAALEHYRLQLYNYAYVDHRFRYPALTAPSPYVTSYVGHDTAAAAAAFAAYVKFDPRCAYRVPEEPKPQHSYIGLIGMAILSSPDKKLVLSDIYQYILDNYAYFRSRGPGWRNSIRHNLSLNDCFIKSGRSANGKGHYWAIHPANVEDFKKGDFRRRKAQRRVRKHMGLAVPEDDDSPSSTPPPPVTTVDVTPVSSTSSTTTTSKSTKKRMFDVESLLAPDRPAEEESEEAEMSTTTSSRKCSPDTTGDVVTRPCWPCVAAQSPWVRGGGEMSRWHEAVSRLLIRAQQQQQMMNGNKIVKLHETV